MNPDPSTKERDKESAPQDATTALRALPQRLMPKVDSFLRVRWVQIAFVSLLVFALAVVLGPSYSARSRTMAQTLKEGERASANIKATRDFKYFPSKEQLDRERDEAERRVGPVFDHHDDSASLLLSRVTRAFRAMSAIYAPGADESEAQPRAARSGGLAPKAERRTTLPASAPARGAPKPLDDEASRRRFANLLQLDVDAQTFARLKKAKFSAEVQYSVMVLIGSALEQLVISHRGALAPFRGKSITVRHMIGGRPGNKGERIMSSLNSVRDLREVKEQSRRKASVHASKLSAPVREAVAELVEGLLVPNLVYNPAETQRRKEAAVALITSRPLAFVRGQVLIRDGDPITKEHLRIISAMELTLAGVNIVQVLIGLALFVLVVLVTLYRFASQQFARFRLHGRDVIVAGSLLLGTLVLTRGVLSLVGSQHLGIARYMLPVAAGTMLVRLVATAEAAALFGVVASAFTALLVDSSLGLALFYLVTSLAGAYGVATVQSRGTLLRAGMMAGFLGGTTVLCLLLFGGQILPRELILGVLAGVAGGMLSAFVVLALLPVLEWLFAYTTDISLLELANLNHPLLRDLMLRAPGTYHHSMVVGSLAEAACEAIGANGLLARVASYYHDVGKMKNAAYFAENFRTDENPHNRLKPSMSALIIRSHVKDGIEMMREHGIPELVIETASQHHGTALISYFYHKALEQKDPEEDIAEADYRYPGPKPQSREAGVIMVADGVEAAARSIGESNDDRLRAVVQKIINTQFTDGQLDQCDLTLRDLHLIARSFLQVLRGIYHARPTYPWQQRAKDETRKKAATRREGTGGHVAVSREDGAPAKGGRKEASETANEATPGKEAAAQPEPQGAGRGAGAAQPESESGAATESSQDIKRLGLN